ncbi:MAG: tetratricopeptide repeat protein, partial [Alphaproteobacteria bacterium]|nr:tetratricopeptide repeat protein [Alphaproteobacteria bacterium]
DTRGAVAALAKARASGDRAAEAWALLALGEAQLAGGAFPKAEETLRTALAHMALIEDYPGTTRTLVKLGLARRAAGDEAGAQAFFEEARTLDRSLGEPVGVTDELQRQGLTD